MIAYDRVLPVLLQTCQAQADFDLLELAVAIQDLRGRVRLVLEPSEQGGPDVAKLEQELQQALGDWFSGPVLCKGQGTVEQKRLAGNLVEMARSRAWPAEWPRDVQNILGGSDPLLDCWRGLAATLTKDSWLSDQRVRRPWPLIEQTPSIVSFFSYKGGVGRSTLLGVVARQLSEEGERVVAVDLDLEGPGLATLFDITPRAGVVDFLLEHMATGRSTLDDKLEITVDSKVAVVPAGRLDTAYLSKLARLDYTASTQDESPVHSALKALLDAVKRSSPSPDYILLDSRSGLHDLGGLSLHALAHVDVLVTRGNPGGVSGLRLALHTLGRRLAQEDQRVVVVHSMEPFPIDDARCGRFRMQVHDAFASTLYAGMDDVPADDDETGAHYPLVVGLREELARVDKVDEISTATLNDERYTAVRGRIEELCSPEGEA